VWPRFAIGGEDRNPRVRKSDELTAIFGREIGCDTIAALRDDGPIAAGRADALLETG
jgi:hypothetical protein